MAADCCSWADAARERRTSRSRRSSRSSTAANRDACSSRNFQDLIQEIQASFDPDAAVGKAEILRPLLEADLLVLDELGSQKPTQFVQDVLYYVINSRYNTERTTIFTTNYYDDASVEGQRLQDRVGDRLRSRLHEMTELISIKGVPDHRIANKQSRNIL